MIFERIRSEGLAHNSYFIASDGHAAVIDPRRDCRVYADLARRYEASITHIFETHRNEDYVIGSVELAGLTGATVHHGHGLTWRYGRTVHGGQLFDIGRLQLTALSTPGHTDESMSYLVADLATGPAPVMAFTGDTLFVGSVGRTDLYGPGEAPRLAAALYDSIFGNLLQLGDGVIICPAHGGGSVCGSHIADRELSTIGIERGQNAALRAKDSAEFVRQRLAERPERPPYFRQMEKLNLEGAPPLGRGEPALPPALTLAQFRAALDNGAVLVDTREPWGFGAHIKGAYSIWTSGLSEFAGWFLPYDRDIVLLLERAEDLLTAATNLARLGYDRVAGYLQGGIEDWYGAGLAIERLPVMSVHELKAKLDHGEDILVLDVREREEWDSGHVPAAQHLFLGHLQERLAEVPAGRPVATFCSIGRRSGLAGSILLRSGRRDVSNVLGSMTAWRAAGYPAVRD